MECRNCATTQNVVAGNNGETFVITIAFSLKVALLYYSLLACTSQFMNFSYLLFAFGARSTFRENSKPNGIVPKV